MTTENERFIEYPSMGATYYEEEYGVYEYGVYPEGSVLEGQSSRSFLGSYPTLEEAQAAFPDATYTGNGSHYSEPQISDTAPDWFDPAAAGERWDEDY